MCENCRSITADLGTAVRMWEEAFYTLTEAIRAQQQEASNRGSELLSTGPVHSRGAGRIALR